MISYQDQDTNINNSKNNQKIFNNEEKLPIIDISLLKTPEGKKVIAKEIHDTCKEWGFFYIKGHGVEKSLTDRLESLLRKFFSLPSEVKLKYKMGLFGRDWLGYFKVGQEITEGEIDYKEGSYIDIEVEGDSDPVNGKNLYPTPQEEEQYGIVGFKETIETYMRQLTILGKEILSAIAISLNLEPDFFETNYPNPSTLMGLLHYPSFRECPDDSTKGKERFGTNTHTDWNLTTILYQDTVGGLQVKSKDGFIDAPPIEGTFVCNIGDMLDRMTGGYYLSNEHRVKLNTSGRTRISVPFFLDPNWESTVTLIEGVPKVPQPERWDKRDIHKFQGTYGQYFMSKVGRVFPEYIYNDKNKSNVHK